MQSELVMVSSLCRVVYAVRDKETSCRDLLSDKDYACSYCPLSLMVLLLVVTCRGLFSNCLTSLCIKSEAIICDRELSRSWILDIAKDLMKIFMCRVEKYFSWKSDARLSGTPGLVNFTAQSETFLSGVDVWCPPHTQQVTGHT